MLNDPEHPYDELLRTVEEARMKSVITEIKEEFKGNTWHQLPRELEIRYHVDSRLLRNRSVEEMKQIETQLKLAFTTMLDEY